MNWPAIFQKDIGALHITKKILIAACVVGVALRLGVMFLGNNYDFESYIITYQAAYRWLFDTQHISVYDQTSRYNYGPVWFLWLLTLGHIAQIVPLEMQMLAWRLLIVCTLIAADLIIIGYLYRHVHRFAAFAMALSPASIIITGFHNQFDNIPVALMLLATMSYEHSSKKLPHLLRLSFAIGLGLVIKHVFFFWPIWVAAKQKSALRMVLALTIPYAVFVASFLPFISSGYVGIMKNVFLYSSYNNAPLYSLLVPSILTPFFNARVFFAIAMGIVLPLIIRKWSLQRSISLYVIALVIFTPALANQYLVIPLVGILSSMNVFYWIYYTFTSIHLMLDYDGLYLLKDVMVIMRRYDFFPMLLASGLLYDLITHNRTKIYSLYKKVLQHSRSL